MPATAMLLIALTATVLIECLLTVALLRPERSRRWQLVLDVAVINLFTNPLANWAYLEGAPFAGIEIAVVTIEAVLLARLLPLPAVRALGLSLGLNAVTAALSFLPVWPQ